MTYTSEFKKKYSLKPLSHVNYYLSYGITAIVIAFKEARDYGFKMNIELIRLRF